MTVEETGASGVDPEAVQAIRDRASLVKAVGEIFALHCDEKDNLPEPTSLGEASKSILIEGKRDGGAIPEEELKRRRIMVILGSLSNKVFGEFARQTEGLNSAYERNTDCPIPVPGTRGAYRFLMPLVEAERAIRYGRGS